MTVDPSMHATRIREAIVILKHTYGHGLASSPFFHTQEREAWGGWAEMQLKINRTGDLQLYTLGYQELSYMPNYISG